MNSWIKVYYLHHTQRGGHGSKQKSYLRPLYRHFLRSYGWRTGLAESFFKSKSTKHTVDESEEAVEASDEELDAIAELY